MDSNEWDITIPSEGDLESKLRAIERQLANQVKEFVFVLDADTGEELYRDKGTFDGVFDTFALRNVLQSRRVIIITHNHPSGNLTFSLKDLTLFFKHHNVLQLRATSGKKTHVLFDKGASEDYFIVREQLIQEKLRDKYKRKISQQSYNEWYQNVLPYILQEELFLQIQTIIL